MNWSNPGPAAAAAAAAAGQVCALLSQRAGGPPTPSPGARQVVKFGTLVGAEDGRVAHSLVGRVNSLIGRFISLFDRFLSLFARLGNFPLSISKYQQVTH